jgi:cytochrome P450
VTARALPVGVLPSALQRWLWVHRPEALLAATQRASHLKMRLEPKRPLLVVSQYDDIQRLLTDDAFVGDASNERLEPAVGVESLLTSSGDKHRRLRGVTSRLLSRDAVASYEPWIRSAVGRHLAGSSLDDGPTRLLSLFLSASLDALLAALAGARGGSLRWTRQVLISDLRQARAGGLRQPPWPALAANRMFVEQEWRTAPLNEQPEGNTILSRARCESLSEDERSGLVLSLLVTGHETSALAAAWSVERALSSPANYQLLTGAVDADDQRLLRGYVRETLRMRPVIPLIARVCETPTRLGRQDLCPGDAVAASAYALHHDAAFYPDPERFDPHRFAGSTPPRPWIPFGGGTRRCPGIAYAELLVCTLLGELLRSFTVRRVPRHSYGRWQARSISVAPGDGLPIQLARRRHQSTPAGRS